MSTVNDTDLLAIQRSGTTYKVTAADLAAFSAASAVPDATETVKGKVELATTAEASVGTDTVRAVTPAGVKAAFAGNTSVTTLTGDVTGSASGAINGTTTVTTAIAAGAIVDADVNASAAIAGTKISPDFGSQAVTTTGTITGASLIPTSSTAPTNGIYLPAANTVGIATDSSLAMLLDSSNRLVKGHTGSLNTVNLGGSTITPGIQQHAVDQSNASIGLTNWQNAATAAHLILGKSRSGTVGVHAATPANDIVGAVNFAASDGTTFGSAAHIRADADALASAGSTPGRLTFSTSAPGSTSPTERMRIRSDGNIAIKGTGSSFATLFNQGPITGSASTSYGNFTSAVVQSDVTSNAYGYSTYLTTAAATFTLANLHHYNARQTTLGAGSTITNQYGFIADASLTGAENNFGFYASLTAATGRWNFFANGTANNYFAGSVGIGTTTLTEKLTVSGNVLSTGNFITGSSTGGLLSSTNAGYTAISGDTSVILGANILCYGGSHPTAPSRITIRQGTANRLAIWESTGNVSINSASDTGDRLYVNGSIRSNGQISTLGGDSAAAPGFTWAGDENTGMFRNAIDSLAFSAGGVEVFRVNTNGTSGRRQIYSPGTCEVWSSNSLFLEGGTDVRSLTVANNTTTVAANVAIGATSGVLQRSTSSIKYKTEVENAELSYSEALVYGSRPVWYRSLCSNDNAEHSHWGFIAEEVAQVDPRMIHWGGDDGTEPEGVQYERYVVHLVNVIQQQKQRLDSLETRLAALEAKP